LYYNMFFALLPYIEQNNVFQLGMTKTTPGPWWHPVQENGAYGVRGTVIKTYICPSDPTEPSNIDTFFTTPEAGFASGNYGFNVMVFDPRGNQATSGATIVGGMPDGTTNTVMFAHRYKRCDANGPNGIGGTGQTDWAAYPTDGQGGQWARPGFGFATYFIVNGPVPAVEGSDFWGGIVSIAGEDFSSGRSVPPSGIPFQTKPANGECNFLVTQSPHETMVVGLGDGSVRTVSASISVLTWWQACNPKDGAVLGSDW